MTDQPPADFFSEDDVLRLVAKNQGMELISLQDLKITPELLDQVPARVARLLLVFPVGFTQTSLKVALTDPFNLATVADLERETGKRVIPCVAPEAEILLLIQRYYGGPDSFSELGE